jgi:hypothetical protein
MESRDDQSEYVFRTSARPFGLENGPQREPGQFQQGSIASFVEAIIRHRQVADIAGQSGKNEAQDRQGIWASA